MELSIGEYFESWRSAAAKNSTFTDWLKSEPLDVDQVVLPGAKTGDAQAQFLLAHCYTNGHGVPKDDVQAVAWLAKAAAQGLADAQFCLGCCFIAGRGVPREYAYAFMHFVKAAEQGHAQAQELYDLANALYWYQTAAEQGDAESRRRLDLYENNQPVPADFIEAGISINPKTRGNTERT